MTVTRKRPPKPDVRVLLEEIAAAIGLPSPDGGHSLNSVHGRDWFIERQAHEGVLVLTGRVNCVGCDDPLLRTFFTIKLAGPGFVVNDERIDYLLNPHSPEDSRVDAMPLKDARAFLAWVDDAQAKLRRRWSTHQRATKMTGLRLRGLAARVDELAKEHDFTFATRDRDGRARSTILDVFVGNTHAAITVHFKTEETTLASLPALVAALRAMGPTAKMLVWQDAHGARKHAAP